MSTFKTALIGLSVSLVLCSIRVRRAGWLDRVVQYQKKRFIDDFMKHHVKITARIEKAPPGYVDSKDWDYDSVIRLLTLIRDSEGAAPVRRALRRTMKHNRRFLNSSESHEDLSHSMQDYPNETHDAVYDDEGRPPNEIEWPDVDLPPNLQEYFNETYDTGNDAEANPSVKIGWSEPYDVIVVANPVEAKLPSASISVGLLKSILERRASAGRVMPTTELNIFWPVTPKRSASTKPTARAIESTPESTSEASEAQANDSPAGSGNGKNI